MPNNVVRHPQWPPQPPRPDPDCDCDCGPSLPDWSSGFLGCWNQIAQMENVFTTIIKRIILDPSSGVMDVITGGSTGGGTSTSGNVVISTTPPGNPTAGLQWWNGSVLQVWDGTKWNQVGPSAATGPVPTTTRVFNMTQPTSVTIAANTWAVIPFTTQPTVDTESGWNSVTHQYMPNKAGIYLFLVRAPLTSSAGGSSGLALLRNDAGVFSGTLDEYITVQTVYGGTSVASGWIGSSGVAVMNGTTDFVRLWAYGNGTIGGASGQSFMQAYLLP